MSDNPTKGALRNREYRKRLKQNSTDNEYIEEIETKPQSDDDGYTKYKEYRERWHKEKTEADRLAEEQDDVEFWGI